MSRAHGSSKDVFAVFDISSSSVAGAHVLLEKDSKGITTPLFLASTRLDATLQEDLNIPRFVDDTIKHLEEVIMTVKKADLHKPHFIQVVLASPWYSAQTRTISYKKDGISFVCTEKLVNDLIAKEIDYLLTHEEGSFGGFGKGSVIVERQISQVKLNGYTTGTPFGKSAQTLDISLTITIAPKLVLDRFTDTLKRAYGTTKIGFTTSPYTTFIATRDAVEINGECVIIDVGEEVTDVAFVKEGLFMYQHSFPIGTYALYRQVAASGGTGMEAKALLESYRLDKLAPSPKDLIAKAIDGFRLEWQKGLQQILDNGHYGFCMPEHCFVLSDPRFELIFIKIIETDPFIQHTCSRGIVRPFFVGNVVVGDKARSLDGTSVDSTLAVGALFVERLMQTV